MKLNLDIIRDYLPECYQAKRRGPDNLVIFWGRPVFYEVGCVMEENTLYVVRADALPHTLPPENTAVICIGNVLSREWLAGNIHLLTVSSGFSVSKAFNAIQDIYNHFDDWDRALLKELGKDLDFDINRIIQLGMEVLENSFSVLNPSLEIILSAEFMHQESGMAEIVVSNKSRILALEQMTFYIKNCALERHIRVPYISSYMTPSAENVRSYCYNLYTIDCLVGRACVTERNRPFRESDYPLADLFFNYFYQAFLKYLHSQQKAESPRITALRNLLRHDPLSSSEYEQLAFRSDEEWVCFKLKEQHDKKHLPKDYMCAALNAMMPETCYTVIQSDAIIGLLCICQSTGNNLELFENFLKSMDYVGGISDRLTDIRKLDHYLLQADYLMECVYETRNVER
ncbi:MAG: hypothetical protein LBS00_09475 [Synergistaceae bacterium]|jgi:hypothetical protein|nr:hypothetical protein [Synergistaceae bacterium]